MKFIKPFQEISKTDVALAGGKGASLGEMTQAGIPVPPGFVLLANAFEHFITTTELAVEIDATLHTVNHEEMHTIEHASEKIKALILDADMPKDIEEEVKKCFKKLNANYVAVRSSATSEDSASAAWAGQLDSYLNTTEETLLDHVKKCWASLFTPRAIFYRFEKQLHKEKISVAVVVQKMVDSESSGIAFSVHPVTQDYNQLIIEAGFGLGEAIVSGQITPDSYVVEKQPLRILEKKIHEQAKGLFRAQNGGNAWQQLGERGKKQVLKEEEILELAKLIMKIEQHYGFPVDVEWAREKGKFYIVQSRPITTLSFKEDIEEKENFATKFVKLIKKQNQQLYPPIHNVSVFVESSGFENKKYFEPYYDDKTPIPILTIMKEGRGTCFLPINKLKNLSKEFFIRYWKTTSVLDKQRKMYNNKHRKLESLNLKMSYKYIKNNSESVLLKDLERVGDSFARANASAWFCIMFDKDFCLELLKQLKANISEKRLNEIWDQAIISVSDSFERKRKRKLFNELMNQKEIDSLSEEFQYFFAGYDKILPLSITKEKMKEEIRDLSLEKIKEELKRYDSEREAKKKKYEKWISTLSQDEKKLVNYIQEIIDLRDERKEPLAIGLTLIYRVGQLFFEKAGIPEEYIMYSCYPELSKGSEYIKEQKQNILKRKSGVAVLIDENGNLSFELDTFEECNNYMLDFYKSQEQLKEKTDEIKGSSAFGGKVRGLVRVVKNIEKEGKNLQIGEILVTGMTRPEFVPLMKISSAIITDEGGITSHAAIVSRELKKPCVIGTKIATHVLKDGDLVEVDADNGLIKILEKDNIKSNKDVVKVYKKFMTRSVPLLHCQFLYYGEKEGIPKVVGDTFFFNPLFIHNEARGVDTYYDFTDPQQDPFNMLGYIQENANEFFKRADIYEKDCKMLLTLLKKEDAKQFDTIFHLVLKIWPMRVVTSILCSYMADKVTNKTIVQKSSQLREKYDKLGYMAGYGIVALAKKKIPKEYVPFVDVLTFEEISSRRLPHLNLVNQRKKFYIYYEGKVITDHSLKAFEEKYKIALSDPATEIKASETITGIGTSKGKVTGKVRIVFEYAQLNKVKKNDILVTSMTTPDFLPAMKRASAFITDEGGMLCHAAIVARELKKPCIIGTKIATKVLRDGMEVEVDANHGLVSILSEKNKIDLGNYHEYQRCFQWKGGGLPFLFSDIFMGHYKTLQCLITLSKGVWTNFLPKKVVEKTLEDGKKLISNTQAFDSYKTSFEEYKKECSIFFAKIIKKHNVSQEELKKLLVYFSKLFYYYSRTEFFYVDKAFEYAKTHKETAKNLEKFDAIKNKGREYLNNLFLGAKSYFEELLHIISEKFSVTTKDLKSYSGKELLDLFDKRKVSKETLEARRLAYIMLPINGKINTIYGKEAEDIITIFFQKAHDLQRHELRGVTANKGKVIGRVRIFSYGPEEFDKLKGMIQEMQKGEILVADTTSPELMMACKKAAAILTNQGGLMSHAAIVSRELEIPCIVGLGNITDVVTNGDTIEVDADKGIIKILEKQEKSNIPNKEDYVITFWASGVSILYTDMVVDMYKSYDPLICIYKGKYYQYLRREKFELAGNVGINLYGNKEKFEKYLNDLKVISDNFKKYCSLHISQEQSITKPIVEEFFEHALKFHRAYSETGFEHTDKAFTLAMKEGNELMTKNLNKIGEIKNDIRAVMNSIFFESSSYFDILINHLSADFNLNNKTLLKYTQSEILDLFDGKKVDKKEINSRDLSFAVLVREGNVKYYSGPIAENIYFSMMDKSEMNKDSFEGVIASKGKMSGKMKGKVKVIPVDYSGNFASVNKAMKEMEQGQILVAETTAPELMVACRKASAIITDQGGLMSHAAIVSRELKIPCIVGTKIATKVLKDGDLVEIDIDKGTIRILKRT